jgi:hypothetical protein
MMHKKILRPDRLRQVPAQFSWVDQRLVRENFLRHADPAAWSLYLVRVTVADAQGLAPRSGDRPKTYRRFHGRSPNGLNIFKPPRQLHIFTAAHKKTKLG